MLNLSKIVVSNKTFGDVMFLADVRKYNDFNNKDNQIGWKYEVLVPALGLEKVTFKVEDLNNPIPDDVVKRVRNGEMIQVKLSGIEAKIYNNGTMTALSCKASGIELVK